MSGGLIQIECQGVLVLFQPTLSMKSYVVWKTMVIYDQTR